MKKFLFPTRSGSTTGDIPSSVSKTVLREIIEFVILVVVIVLPLRMFIAEPYIVLGASMSDTFETSHYLIVNKFWHKIHGVERGDVLVFTSPTDETKSYIKRVIALPGETIKIEDQAVYIKQPESTEFIKVREPYIKNQKINRLEVTLGDDEYFVMGDNRNNSFDSRNWGPLNKDLIKGEAVLRLYPFDRMGYLPGNASYPELETTTN